ncbi:hypothetical protein Hypma_009893 [Hypsizygus marmoreus]|uniref:Uncharacterized protein n=1 Tax=Hypsizygus marmoreus TaxID=39966 RepID=A0A369JLJ4_HYPMA|nr:hypothetical protein Hypma_009893 [Hypsizygus marmoreus]
MMARSFVNSRCSVPADSQTAQDVVVPPHRDAVISRQITDIYVARRLSPSLPPAQCRTTAPPVPQSPLLQPVHAVAVLTLLRCSWEADVKRDAHGAPEQLPHPQPESVAFSCSSSSPPPSATHVERPTHQLTLSLASPASISPSTAAPTTNM